MIMEIELQSQVLDAINYVLYDQLKFKGNRMDYYNALNLYMHQVGVAAVRADMTFPLPHGRGICSIPCMLTMQALCTPKPASVHTQDQTVLETGTSRWERGVWALCPRLPHLQTDKGDYVQAYNLWARL